MTTKDYAESFGLTIGESKRMDCPECGRKNTFSISNINGTIKWNCFHASCDERGTGSLKVTRRNAADILRNIEDRPKDVPFVKPKSWSRQLSNKARDYLRTVNSAGRYEDVYYDVKRNRLVYPIFDTEGKLVDGAGRSLGSARPKWYRYGNYGGGFKIGMSRTAVVVEDIPSAISISEWVTGYALLGTSLRREHIEELKKYSKVVVALDKDATDKALTMVCTLNRVVPTDILMLDKDLKSMGDTERERLIRTSMS